MVVGLINLHGTPLVILDFARQATEDFRQPALNSCIAVIETGRRCFGLLCDDVEGIIDMSGSAWQDLPELIPGINYLSAGQPGISDLLILRDPEHWLSAAQETSLDLALEHYTSTHAAPGLQ